MDVESHLNQAVDHALDLFFGGALLHHNNHLRTSSVLFTLETFNAPALIDYTLEQTLKTLVVERAGICFFDSAEYFALPFRVINSQIEIVFNLSNFDRASGTFIQQPYKLLVDIIDFLTPVFDAHCNCEPFNQAANAATRCTRSGLPMCCSISLTIELPTIAASA